MNIPQLLKKENKKYLLDKIYPKFALSTDLSTGTKECFNFHDLGLIERTKVERQAKRGGVIKA